MALTENFDGVTPPALPGTLSYLGTAWRTLATSAPTGPNVLISSAAGTVDGALTHDADHVGADVEASASILLGDIGSGNACDGILVARWSGESAAYTAASGYYVEVLNSGAAVAIGLSRRNGGSGTSLASGPAGALATGVYYRIVLTATGTDPVALTVEVQRFSDSLWLSSAGTWVAGRGPCIVYSDSSASRIGSQGNSGVFCYQTLGDYTLFDAVSHQIGVADSDVAATATVTGSGATTATLAASAVGGAGPYSYQWHRSPSIGFTPDGGNAIDGATAATLDDSGLANDTTYYYRCVVTDSAAVTATSNEVAARTTHVARDWYFAAAGSDAAGSGTAASPYQTLERASALAPVPGDRLLFHGGDTFSGTLTVNGSGTATAPITITGYGAGRAEIACDTADGIRAIDREYLIVDNLAITGTSDGGATAVSAGIMLQSSRTAGNRLRGIVVDRCAIADTRWGVLAYATAPDLAAVGFDGLRITGNAFTGCPYAAIATGATTVGWPAGSYPAFNDRRVHRHLYVADNRIVALAGFPGSDSMTSNPAIGMTVGNVDGALIERNLINGLLGGGAFATPVGIWTVGASNVHVRFNEICGIEAMTGVDGAAFDADGGSETIVFEYNYSHDNDGGLFICFDLEGVAGADVAYARTQNLTVRFNWSVNDCRNVAASSASPGVFTFVRAGSTTGVGAAYVYHNTIHLPDAANAFLVDSNDAGNAGQVFENNVFSVAGRAVFARLAAAAGSGKYTFRGNNYFFNGEDFSITAGGGAYDSLGAWQAAGQETFNGHPVGFALDPLFASTASPGATVLPAARAGKATALDVGNAALHGTALPLWLLGRFPPPIDFHNRTFDPTAPDVGAAQTSRLAGFPGDERAGANYRRLPARSR